jgi:hypothetical protein
LTTGNKRKSYSFQKKVTYLNATRRDLRDIGYGDFRISISDLMRSKPVEVTIIVLLILYSLLVMVYLAVNDQVKSNEGIKQTFQIIELCFLVVF